MSITTKLLSSAVAIFLLSGAAAYAGGVNVELNVGGPAAVYAPPPPPVYAAPSYAYVGAPWVEGYDPHHRRHDWRYWHDHPQHGAPYYHH